MCFCIGAAGSVAGGGKPTAPAKPDLGINDPERACALLSGVGLPGRRWRHSIGDEYVCSSDERDLGGSGINGLPNDLSFLVEGTATLALRGKVLLDVFAVANAPSAHREMIRACDELFTRATGAPTPPDVRVLLEQGRAGARNGKNGKHATVERVPFGENRPGYTLKLTLQL